MISSIWRSSLGRVELTRTCGFRRSPSKRLLTKWKKENDDIKHLEEFIRSCGTYSNMRIQAESKQKIIDKMKFAGLTEKPVPDRTYEFKFPDSEKISPPVP